MKKARNLNHLASQHLSKRKTESPTQHLKNQLTQNNGGAKASFSLPTEPEPIESIKNEDDSMEHWNSAADTEMCASGGSDYEVTPDMYSDQMEEEQYFQGSQVKPPVLLVLMN